jgi:hypothetical protein
VRARPLARVTRLLEDDGRLLFVEYAPEGDVSTVHLIDSSAAASRSAPRVVGHLQGLVAPAVWREGLMTYVHDPKVAQHDRMALHAGQNYDDVLLEQMRTDGPSEAAALSTIIARQLMDYTPPDPRIARAIPWRPPCIAVRPEGIYFLRRRLVRTISTDIVGPMDVTTIDLWRAPGDGGKEKVVRRDLSFGMDPCTVSGDSLLFGSDPAAEPEPPRCTVERVPLSGSAPSNACAPRDASGKPTSLLVLAAYLSSVGQAAFTHRIHTDGHASLIGVDEAASYWFAWEPSYYSQGPQGGLWKMARDDKSAPLELLHFADAGTVKGYFLGAKALYVVREEARDGGPPENALVALPIDPSAYFAR